MRCMPSGSVPYQFGDTRAKRFAPVPVVRLPWDAKTSAKSLTVVMNLLSDAIGHRHQPK